MVNKKDILAGVILFSIVLSIFPSVYAQLESNVSREDRLKFNHVLFIENVTTDPISLIPGKPAILKLTLENTAADYIKDIRVSLDLPSQIAPYDDITQKKVPQLEAGEKRLVEFIIVASPTTAEGVYKIPVTSSYQIFLGEDRYENNTLSIVVRNTPSIYTEAKTTDIYQGKPIGDAVIKIVNNNLANVRFLNVELGESPDYEILGYKREYIGDLDSDDFAEASFNLKVKTDAEGISPPQITLPVRLTYRDTFNNVYQENPSFNILIRDPQDLGIKKSQVWIIALAVGVLILIYLIYRAIKKRRLKNLQSSLHRR